MASTGLENDETAVTNKQIDKRKIDLEDGMVAGESKKAKKKKLEKPKKRKDKFFAYENHHFTETQYYFENDLRKVMPYYYTYQVYCKGRWEGRTILDIFKEEFHAYSIDYYEKAMSRGSLTVNGQKVSPDYKLKPNDFIENTVHRHEVPVTSQKPQILELNDEMLVIDKPASIPVHPCGRYRHNSVIFILAKEYGLKNLMPVHRLDRLTSGILLITRAYAKARQMEEQIRTRQVTKEYVCRVEGQFPDGIIECTEPIAVLSHKIGICHVSPKGRDCVTVFKKLNYNGHSSVVSCKPLTGRMHQIRVHLQYLGYPIINDYLYNSDGFGPMKGKGGVTDKTDQELIQELIRRHNIQNWLEGDLPSSELTEIDLPPANGAASLFPDSAIVQEDKQLNGFCDNIPSQAIVDKDFSKADVSSPLTEKRNDENFHFDLDCPECRMKCRDPKPDELIMFLHAWKYKGPDWEYETVLPAWASSDWKG